MRVPVQHGSPVENFASAVLEVKSYLRQATEELRGVIRFDAEECTKTIHRFLFSHLLPIAEMRSSGSHKDRQAIQPIIRSLRAAYDQGSMVEDIDLCSNVVTRFTIFKGMIQDTPLHRIRPEKIEEQIDYLEKLYKALDANCDFA